MVGITYIALCMIHQKDGAKSPIHMRVIAESREQAIQTVQDYNSWPFTEITKQVAIVQIDPLDEMRTVEAVVAPRRRRSRVRRN